MVVGSIIRPPKHIPTNKMANDTVINRPIFFIPMRYLSPNLRVSLSEGLNM